MCGRYSLATADAGRLRARFPLGESVEIRQRFNVAPGDDVLAVTTSREGEPRGDVLRWGLVPHWAADATTGYKMINARAETVAERPAYRDAFARRRCLLVADGFYEWERREGLAKQPWWVTQADGKPFAFAGLWAIWHGPDETVLRTCSIVTTHANGSLRELCQIFTEERADYRGVKAGVRPVVHNPAEDFAAVVDVLMYRMKM